MAASWQCIVKPFGGGASGPGSRIGGGNQTIGTICQLPAGAMWVRFRFACWSAADVPVANAAYAPTSQKGDGYNAYDENGQISVAGWRAVTFDSLTKRSCIEQIAAGTVAARFATSLPGIRGAKPAQFEPQVVCSDWLPFDALDRTDGGAAPLLNLRLHVPPEQPAFRLGHAAAPDASLDFVVAGTYSFGNNAAPPYGGLGHDFPVSAMHGIDVICGQPTRTLIVVGDSIGSGDYTTGSGTSYGLAAAQLLTRQGAPTTAAILANPLQTTPCFIGNATRFITDELVALRGSMIVLQCWSGNDPPSIEAARNSFRTALALAAFCDSHGVTPILATAAPVSAKAPEQEAARRHGNELVRRAGFACLDIDRIVGAGTTPNTYKPGFSAWDNIHLNDFGHLAVAEALVSIVLELRT